VNDLDPRVKRTRQLLASAFEDLLNSQDFGSITVQDIAHKATVNRATFYAHFDDKFALLDWIIRDKFRTRALAALEPFEPTPESVHRLISMTGKFLTELASQCPKRSFEAHPLVEAIIQNELHAHIMHAGSCRETAAAILSWSIFGVARNWSRGPHTEPVESAADRAVELLTNGVLVSASVEA
jgi:AcrR family transcriptional regulator